MPFYDFIVPVGIALVFGLGVSFLVTKSLSWFMFMFATSISMAIMIQVGALGIEWIIVPSFLLLALLVVRSDTFE